MLLSAIRDFYSKLQDDESKRIFFHRLNYFITRDYSHINSMVSSVCYYHYIISDIYKLKNTYDSTKRVVLYGTGEISIYVLKYLEYNNVPVTCFCDSDLKKVGTVHLGLPVVSLDSLDKETDLICISTIKFQDDVHDNLLNLNFCNVFRISENGKQYYLYQNNASLINKNGVYIDAGCLDGLTIKDFVDYSGGKYKKIYGFEPDSVSFKKTQDFISDNMIENTVILQNGLWSNNCELLFNNTGSGISNISKNGSITINCVSIDSALKEEDFVTFIKMDIEGSELEALKGASNTIKKFKPDLAICIYHKPEDILEIPLFIQELVPEYKFFIRHYSMENAETVLYAKIID